MTDVRSRLELLFAEQVRGARLPAPEREYRFAPPRRWLFDFAWNLVTVGSWHYDRGLRGEPFHRSVQPIAVEIEGGTYVEGRHSRGQGFEKDCEKYAEALISGWRVLRVTGAMVLDGRAIALTRRLFDA